MKKSRWIALGLIILFIFAIPIVIVYLLNNGNSYNKYIADKNVPVYLENQGYTDSDIEESHYVEPKGYINKDFYHGHYMVVFKNDPDVTYYYGITKKEKQIKQFCEKEKVSPNGDTDTIEENTKHSEKDCAKSL